MKKSNPTPKEILKKKIYGSNVMKVPTNEGNFDNKENITPFDIKNMKRATRKTHTKEDRDETLPNPFKLPFTARCFSTPSAPRKEKPIRFNMDDTKTICDIDPSFYKAIEGRPLRQFDDIKVYMRNIRDITLYKANAVYLKDKIIAIDANTRFELEEYEKINALYNKHVSNFSKFANESYEEAKKVQVEAEKVFAKLASQNDQLESYSFEYVKVRNQISVISFNLDTLTMYARFFYSISPIQWQIRQKDVVHGIRWCDATSSSDSVGSPSVSSLDKFKVILNNYKGKPSMYFIYPTQLLDFYEYLEQQCLNYMQIDGFMKDILKTHLKQRNALKAEVKHSIDEMAGAVKEYEKTIIFYEEKADAYKEVFDRVLMSAFQDLFASYDSVKLFTCVQYVNTRVFENPEDPKDSVVTLMFQLERLYLELSSALDNFDQNVVKAATKEMFSEDIKVMNRAYKAQRDLRECNILTKSLFTSFEPNRNKQRIKRK